MSEMMIKLKDGKEYTFTRLKLTPRTSRYFDQAESGSDMKKVVALMELINISLKSNYSEDEIENLFETEAISLDSSDESQGVLQSIFESIAPKSD